MSSVLTDAPFRKTTLVAQLEGAQTGTDTNGNPTFATSTANLVGFVAPDKTAQLVRRDGADPHMTPVKVELDSPLVPPAGVGVGSVLLLDFQGRPSRMRVTGVIEPDIIGVAFGTLLLGEVTPVG